MVSSLPSQAEPQKRRGNASKSAGSKKRGDGAKNALRGNKNGISKSRDATKAS